MGGLGLSGKCVIGCCPLSAGRGFGGHKHAKLPCLAPSAAAKATYKPGRLRNARRHCRSRATFKPGVRCSRRRSESPKHEVLGNLAHGCERRASVGNDIPAVQPVRDPAPRRCGLISGSEGLPKLDREQRSTQCQPTESSKTPCRPPEAANLWNELLSRLLTVTPPSLSVPALNIWIGHSQVASRLSTIWSERAAQPHQNASAVLLFGECRCHASLSYCGVSPGVPQRARISSSEVASGVRSSRNAWANSRAAAQ